MSAKVITSVHNQRVKDAIKLRDHRARSKQGRFLIDGSREIVQAARGEVHFVECFVCDELCTTDDSRQALDAMQQSGAALWYVPLDVFERLAYGERHEGVIAIAQSQPRTLAKLSAPPDGLIVVLEGLEKPGNLGAVLRSADAAGVGAVIVADARTDLFNPNCIRASLGTVFTQTVCQANAAETIAWLRAQGMRIFAARLDATTNYTDVDLAGPAAIVLGSEAEGVSSIWRAAEVTPIKLPMRGAADSLNVSATAAVLFYEALRQREIRGPANP